jgi:hypothetical protein
MGLCLLLHRYCFSSATVALPFLPYPDLALTYQSFVDEALGGWWGSCQMDMAVKLLARHYCHDVLVSLVARDTLEHIRKIEAENVGKSDSQKRMPVAGRPSSRFNQERNPTKLLLPVVRTIEGETLRSIDILTWTRCVAEDVPEKQKEKEAAPPPAPTLKPTLSLVLRTPSTPYKTVDVVSAEVMEKADTMTSDVMEEINWNDQAKEGTPVQDSPMAKNARKVQRLIIDRIASSFSYAGAFYFPLLDEAKSGDRLYLGLLSEGIGFFVSHLGFMRMKIFFPFNSILSFSCNCEEILMTVGTLFHPTTHHFTPYFQPQLSSVPRHPTEQMVLGSPKCATQLFTHMTEREAVDWYKKARDQLREDDEKKEEYEAQLEECLDLVLSSAPSFRYAHAEHSVSPATVLNLHEATYSDVTTLDFTNSEVATVTLSAGTQIPGLHLRSHK